MTRSLYVVVKIPNIVTGPRVYNLYISVHCIADKYQTGLDIPEEDRLCQMKGQLLFKVDIYLRNNFHKNHD